MPTVADIPSFLLSAPRDISDAEVISAPAAYCASLQERRPFSRRRRARQFVRATVGFQNPEVFLKLLPTDIAGMSIRNASEPIPLLPLFLDGPLAVSASSISPPSIHIGWVARGGHPQPRIHDMRHTFICRALLHGQQENQVDHVVDAIATYVGHTKVSDTYWYVSATPELMGIASGRFSRFSSGDCR
jgi:hypothetical protein